MCPRVVIRFNIYLASDSASGFFSCGAVVVRYEGSIRFSSVGIQTRWANAEELLSCSLLRAHGDFGRAVMESFELVDRISHT